MRLQAVFDKPMIYYPITVLIAACLRDFCIISTPRDLPRFRDLLGDGASWGVSFQYRAQHSPEGIAQAFLMAEDFVGSDDVVLMLGDNIVSGGDDVPRTLAAFKGGATIFAYHVNAPERYGVIEFDQHGKALSIEEKPQRPRSGYAIPGAYIYDSQVCGMARALKPSPRGTSRSPTSTVCPEEAAFVRGFLSLHQFESLLRDMPACEYRDYLANVAAEARRLEKLP